MSGWRQIGGDMSWERHGVVLAKLDAKSRQVELVRITPWLEHDAAAAVSEGLYLVDSTTVDVDDLGIDDPDVRKAMRTAGIDSAEFEALVPEFKAEILASYRGLEDGRTVNTLAAALPGPAEEIAFWSGRETTAKLADYDRELRREALEANFETRMRFGAMPNRQALAFALGDEPFALDLKGADALAFKYAIAVAGIDGSVDTTDLFLETVKALAESLPPTELVDRDPSIEELIGRWAELYGDPSDDDSGIASTAQSLASAMLETLGFEWV
jgi:hypothetical protein